MMDFFAEKNIAPMLIAQMQEPFDDPDWIYELKLDGCRCVAYLEKGKVTLRNKRNMELLPRFPELKGIHEQVQERCILDGELVVLVKGRPDFYELQRRMLMTDRFKIKLGAERLPASFIAYDCLQLEKNVLLDVPLLERKKILDGLLEENERVAVSRYMEEKGIDLFRLTEEQELEGVVAKRKSSLYHQGKRTKEWIKFKRVADADLVICGYIPGRFPGLVLGEYVDGKLTYAGSVSMGVRRDILNVLKKGHCPFDNYPKGKEQAVWCIPDRICTVEYMPNTKDSLRQAVFKGIRDDVFSNDIPSPNADRSSLSASFL